MSAATGTSNGVGSSTVPPASASAPMDTSSTAATTAASASSSVPSTSLAEDPRLEKIVLEYLKRRGFSEAENAMQQQLQQKKTTATEEKSNSTTTAASSSASSSTPNIHTFSGEFSLDTHTHILRQILHYSLTDTSPDAYTHAFEHLRRWTSECMEVYRTELVGVQWPLYAHIFIHLIARGFPHDAHRFFAAHRAEHEVTHKPEIVSMQNVMHESDMHKCEIVRWIQQRKLEVTMSSYSHQLLLAFLEEHQYVMLLKILNEHIHVKIMTRRPLAIEGDLSNSTLASLGGGAHATAAGVFNHLNPMAVNHINTTPIRWGALPEHAAFTTDAQNALRNKLREQALQAKMARVEADKKKKSTTEEKSADGAVKEEDAAADGESAKKKAKLDDGTAAGDSTAAAATAGGDTEMADATDENAAAAPSPTAGPEKEKSKKSKKKDAELAAAANPLRETKEEKEAIEKAVKRQIRVPEPMPLPKREEAIVKLPPISADARLRFLADLNSRQKLSSSSLPSIAFYTFLNAVNSVNSIEISPDAARVSCGMSDSTVRLYDLRDSAARKATNPTSSFGETKEESEVTNVHATLQEEDVLGATNIITGSTLPHKRAGEENTKLPYTKLVGHSGPVYSTSQSPDGSYLLSSSEDCTIRLWHLDTKKNLVIYKGHNYPVWDVAFSPLGYYFASASHDGTARLWSTNTISPLRMFVGHNSDVDCVRWHPNCNYIATGSSDSTARLWDIQSGECVRLFVGHTGGVRSLAMDPEGRYAATGGEDGRVMIWDLGTGRQVTHYNAHEGAVTTLDYSADGEILASGGLDATIQLMEAKKSHHTTTTPLRTFHTKRTPVQYLTFTPRNLLLAAGVFTA